jgi:hypothetical protein
MSEIYRVRIKRADIEVEVESSNKDYVDAKIDQYLNSARLDGMATTKAVAESGGRIAHRPNSVGEFIKKVNAVKKNEVAAALAHFLEYEEHQEEWRPDSVGSKFADIRKVKPANMADLLNKSAFFMKGREAGFYRLSETGVQWVEERLKNAV